jgi:hypothetical protein
VFSAYSPSRQVYNKTERDFKLSESYDSSAELMDGQVWICFGARRPVRPPRPRELAGRVLTGGPCGGGRHTHYAVPPFHHKIRLKN